MADVYSAAMGAVDAGEARSLPTSAITVSMAGER